MLKDKKEIRTKVPYEWDDWERLDYSVKLCPWQTSKVSLPIQVVCLAMTMAEC